MKRFVTWLWANDITTIWGVPNGTLSMMFTCCPNLMFLASLSLEIYRFSNWSFCWLWAVQSWHSFYQLWAHQIDPNCSLVLTLDRPQLFYWVWVRHVAKNNPIKTQEPHIGSGTSYFQWFNQQESRTGFLSQ